MKTVVQEPISTKPVIAEHKTNKSSVLMIVLAIVAVLGVGFGIFGMVSAGKAKDEKQELATELTTQQEAVQKIEEQLWVTVEKESEREGEELQEVMVSSSEEYIYIGQWGVKIKIPENLKNVGYMYDNRGVLHVNGVADGGQYVPEFIFALERNGNGLGTLLRHHKDEAKPETVKVGEIAMSTDEGRSFGEVVYSDGNWFFTYYGPQALVGSEDDKDWEVRSVQLVKEMLKNNISRF